MPEFIATVLAAFFVIAVAIGIDSHVDVVNDLETLSQCATHDCFEIGNAKFLIK